MCVFVMTVKKTFKQAYAVLFSCNLAIIILLISSFENVTKIFRWIFSTSQRAIFLISRGWEKRDKGCEWRKLLDIYRHMAFVL